MSLTHQISKLKNKLTFYPYFYYLIKLPQTKMSASYDSLATPMCYTSNPNFIPLSTDDTPTPHVINGHISESNGPDFLNQSTTYDHIPSVLSTPAISVPSKNSSKSNILNTRLWNNSLYVRRIKCNEKFIKLHQELFPELSDTQMAFVYYNYFSHKTMPHNTAAEFEIWNASNQIKEIVKTRIVQNIISNH